MRLALKDDCARDGRGEKDGLGRWTDGWDGRTTV